MKAVYRKSLGVISGADIDLSDSSFPTLSFKQIINAIKNCDFEGVVYEDLDNTLDDLQRFIIHLLNTGVKVYIKENRRGKFIIDEDEEVSINLTRLIKQMLGIDQLDTTTAKRLFKNLCEILPEVISQKHVEELSGKDKIFKNVLEKVSD
jgi:hypothetical protein